MKVFNVVTQVSALNELDVLWTKVIPHCCVAPLSIVIDEFLFGVECLRHYWSHSENGEDHNKFSNFSHLKL
jgi:hypothetical protein